jgi:hypothetical protein
LFFSGHVASIWIYFLCAQVKPLKYYLGFASLFMAFMVLCMHVHYTYDVYGAFFFTTIIYFMNRWAGYYSFKAKEQLPDVSFYQYCTARL